MRNENRQLAITMLGMAALHVVLAVYAQGHGSHLAAAFLLILAMISLFFFIMLAR